MRTQLIDLATIAGTLTHRLRQEYTEDGLSSAETECRIASLAGAPGSNMQEVLVSKLSQGHSHALVFMIQLISRLELELAERNEPAAVGGSESTESSNRTPGGSISDIGSQKKQITDSKWGRKCSKNSDGGSTVESSVGAKTLNVSLSELMYKTKLLKALLERKQEWVRSSLMGFEMDSD